MTWWIPFPESFNHDPRVRALSRAARGVLAQLVIAAKGTGSIPYVNHHGARGTVLLIALCEGDSRDAAEAIGREYQELVDCRLIGEDDAGQRLALYFGQTAEAPRAKEQPSDAPAPAPFRRKPSDAGEATRTRRLRFDFTKRLGPCAGLDPATTWEAWLATPEGAEVFARRVLGTPPNGGTRSERPAERVPNATRNGTERVPNASERPPSDSPRSSERSEKTGERGSERANAPAPNAFGTPPPRTRSSVPSVRCPTVESAAPFEADVVLDQMRAASGGRFSSAAVSTQMQAFGVLARELIARGHATPDALVKAASHAPHVAWVCRLPGPLTVQRLCADEGRVLIELLTGCATCAECGGDPLASGVLTLPRRPPVEPEGDPQWLLDAERQYRIDNPLPTLPNTGAK